MNKNKIFRRIIKTSLVLVYLVIIAGATVRMTGSGMGCPDWPKCFGYYIPPTDVKELLWSPNRMFEDGQVIIKNEKLWIATKNFKTSQNYQPQNWEEYTKHDYAIFNALHTWVEYINRLFGALSGFACLALFAYSFKFWKEKKSIILTSGIVLFLLLFNAWLGATVVYSVLNPIRISLHMLAALLIVIALIYLLHQAKEPRLNNSEQKITKLFKNTALVTLVLFLLQITMGTRVRESVDGIVKSGNTTELWLQNPNILFYIHRSFSIILLISVIYLWYYNKKNKLNLNRINTVFWLVLIEIASAIALIYFDFPFGSQPIHLVTATLIFGYHFAFVLNITSDYKNKTK